VNQVSEKRVTDEKKRNRKNGHVFRVAQWKQKKAPIPQKNQGSEKGEKQYQS
jgi:hypothetical protein